MGHFTALILAAFSLSLGFVANAAVTKAQCAGLYDACKRDPKNLFDKKPCKRARERCEAAAAAAAADTGSIRDRLHGREALSPKEAARQRLQERNAASEPSMRERISGQDEPAPSMRERISGEEPDSSSMRDRVSGGDPKAEALRRLKARQQANEGSGESNMRNKVKAN